MGKVPFKDSFENLFSLALDPSGLVVDSFDVLSNSWVPRLCRNLNDWELDKMCSLLGLLNGSRPDPLVGDSWEWVTSNKGCFSPKSLYMKLANLRPLVFLTSIFRSLEFRQKLHFLYEILI